MTLLEFNRRKKEIQVKLVSRKTNAAEGGANWKIQPLSSNNNNNNNNIAIIYHYFIIIITSVTIFTTEALICAAQEQTIRTNHIKYNIDKTADSSTCRLCKAKKLKKRNCESYS